MSAVSCSSVGQSFQLLVPAQSSQLAKKQSTCYISPWKIFLVLCLAGILIWTGHIHMKTTHISKQLYNVTAEFKNDMSAFFSAVDGNSDGMISKAEIEEFLDRHGIAGTLSLFLNEKAPPTD